jgi:hypothetical protein
VLLLLSLPLLPPMRWLHAVLFSAVSVFTSKLIHPPRCRRAAAARSNSATAMSRHSVECAAVNKMRPLDFAKAAASAAKALVSAEFCRTLLEAIGKDAAQLPTLSLQHLQR